jgi:long-subunit acyl-CoA synthetase (AMP-forming)
MLDDIRSGRFDFKKKEEQEERMKLNPLNESKRDWQEDFKKYLNENRTLAYMMLKKSEEFKDKTALIQKNNKNEWETISWNIFGDKIKAVAKALIDLKLQPGEMCAIFSQNRAEWAISDLGILATKCFGSYLMQQIQKRKLNILSPTQR